MIRIQQQPIDAMSLVKEIEHENAGAVVLFLGTTRKLTGQRETVCLEYDCYEPMALAELRKLQQQATDRWGLTGCGIVHRVGVVEIGEASVAVAISSPHRAASYEASVWLMDVLKKEVPIWKKEQWADGSTDWVHPEEG